MPATSTRSRQYITFSFYLPPELYAFIIFSFKAFSAFHQPLHTLPAQAGHTNTQHHILIHPQARASRSGFSGRIHTTSPISFPVKAISAFHQLSRFLPAQDGRHLTRSILITQKPFHPHPALPASTTPPAPNQLPTLSPDALRHLTMPPGYLLSPPLCRRLPLLQCTHSFLFLFSFFSFFCPFPFSFFSFFLLLPFSFFSSLYFYSFYPLFCFLFFCSIFFFPSHHSSHFLCAPPQKAVKQGSDLNLLFYAQFYVCILFVRPAGGFWARQRGMCIRKSVYKNYLKMYMFSSGTGPAPNPGMAIALHLLRNCVSHMSGRMYAAFCVYPTVRIKSERKCICLYIQNVLQAAVVKMCISYHTHLFIKKVYTLLYIQNCHALPIFQLPAAMCTHMYMHFILKKCTPYHTYQFAGSSQKKKTKRSFAGRLMTATQLRSAGAAPLHCFTASALSLPTLCIQFAGHTPRCRAQVSPAGHTLPLPRSQKQKKDVKILATRDV